MAPATLALTVAYDGSHFAGFSKQPGLLTVQSDIEEALATVLRREVAITGAGRTDAGVHALGQVASFDLTDEEVAEYAADSARTLRRSLDALTHEGIRIREVRRARPGFSARFDATDREYRYRLSVGSTPPLFSANVAWHVPTALDLAALQAGAAHLLGEHDFRSFCVTSSAEGQRTVREVLAIEVGEEEVVGEQLTFVRVRGNAFLHSMVRAVVGTLVEVGEGKHPPEWVDEVLAARDRSVAGPTAPAHGLMFERVNYPKDVWQ